MPYTAPSVPDTDTGLTGKTALITGGTRGIGEALVARFAAAGATVVTTGRSEPANLPPRATFIQANALTVEGIRDVAEQATATLGHIASWSTTSATPDPNWVGCSTSATKNACTI